MTFSYKQNSLGGFVSNRKNSSTDWSWAEEYDNITKELNQYLIQELMDDSKWD